MAVPRSGIGERGDMVGHGRRRVTGQWHRKERREEHGQGEGGRSIGHSLIGRGRREDRGGNRRRNREREQVYCIEWRADGA